MKKQTCYKCGRPIKRIYFFENQLYGIECWKQHCLPQIEKIRKEKYAQREREQWEKDYALAESLRQKDLSKIRSQFKLSFITSLIKQFEEKGFISDKQREVLRGGKWNGRFYTPTMTNRKDHFNYMVAWYLIGGEEVKKHIEWVFANNYEEKINKKFKEAVGI